VVVPERAAWLGWLPGLESMAEAWSGLMKLCTNHSVGTRAEEHRTFSEIRQEKWGGFEGLAKLGLLPRDCVTAEGTIGVSAYFEDVSLIDRLGLTDPIVSRFPPEVLLRPNDERQLAHDRRAPPGYMEERGLNIIFEPPLTTTRPILDSPLEYCYRLPDGRWMRFKSARPEWVSHAFDPDRLEAIQDDGQH
jgi:hypothetical protein